MRFRKIYLEITNVCNLNCSFCPKTRRPGAFMTEETFSTILKKIEGYTQYLYFHLMGEPLLHPLLPRFLDIAGESGFKVILTTNGTLLEERAEEILDKPALHKVNISLHSMEANASGGRDDYIEQCLYFSKKAADKGIITGFRLWNLDGKETKGQNVLNGEVIRKIELFYPRPWSEGQKGVRLSDRVFLNYGEKFIWPDLTGNDYGSHCFCYGLKDQMGILTDGTAVPCCLDHEGDIRLGNILTQSMEEILGSERTQNIIRGFQRRNAVENLCIKCSYARRF